MNSYSVSSNSCLFSSTFTHVAYALLQEHTTCCSFIFWEANSEMEIANRMASRRPSQDGPLWKEGSGSRVQSRQKSSSMQTPGSPPLTPQRALKLQWLSSWSWVNAGRKLWSRWFLAAEAILEGADSLKPKVPP